MYMKLKPCNDMLHFKYLLPLGSIPPSLQTGHHLKINVKGDSSKTHFTTYSTSNINPSLKNSIKKAPCTKHTSFVHAQKLHAKKHPQKIPLQNHPAKKHSPFVCARSPYVKIHEPYFRVNLVKK